MDFGLDSVIFIGFLLVNITLGLVSSRGIKTIKEYAIGDRNFTTATLVSTIIATWVSGAFFFTVTSESYANGLRHIWVELLGDFLGLFLIGYYFVPRMGEFLGKLSIAEAMGYLFGERVRIVVALAGFIGVAGIISVQLKIAGTIFEYALGISSIYGVLLAGIIVTLYASLGGIKSVTFTDVIQFMSFGTVIPALSYFLLENLGVNALSIENSISSNPLFDFHQVFDFSRSENLTYLFLFIYMMIPSFCPATFQRISMTRNVFQARKSFYIASIACTLLTLIVCWISVLMMVHMPNIHPNDVVKNLLDIPIVGIKGLLLICVISMVMSTVDSYINSTAVLIIHDFCKPLSNFIKDELLATRFASMILGIVATAFCVREGSFLNLLIFSYSFWMPVVSVPFIMAVFGFRSTEKSVILGMIAGISAVFFWDYIIRITLVNSIPIGMLANLIVLMGSHYLLKQSGGWVGIKEPAPLIFMRKQRKEKMTKFWKQIKEFDIIDACNKNCPKGDGLIAIVGFFIMFSVFTSTHTLTRAVQSQYSHFLDFLAPFMFCITSVLISYPLWLPKWKSATGVVWNIIMIVDLICCSFLMVLVSNFAELQLLAFLINIIIICFLVNWHWALLTIVVGTIFTSFFYQNFIAINSIDISFMSSQFELFGLLLVIGATMIIFLKPKQEQYQLTEKRAEHLSIQVCDREEELKKSLALKYEFLCNLEHEGHTPITCITSMGQLLHECYDELAESEKRDIARTIAQSSDRLLRLVDNLIDVSKLSSMTYQLNKTELDLSELVHQRLEDCQKMYVNDKELEFFTDIEDGVIANCDKHYITSTIDNLIINAIQYTNKGAISLTLKKVNNKVKFSIRDDGVGIPKHELIDVFGAFIVSSKTKTLAGGRGVGLALCEKAIKAHGGKIWAESNGKKGAKFIFTI